MVSAQVQAAEASSRRGGDCDWKRTHRRLSRSGLDAGAPTCEDVFDLGSHRPGARTNRRSPGLMTVLPRGGLVSFPRATTATSAVRGSPSSRTAAPPRRRETTLEQDRRQPDNPDPCAPDPRRRTRSHQARPTPAASQARGTRPSDGTPTREAPPRDNDVRREHATDDQTDQALIHDAIFSAPVPGALASPPAQADSAALGRTRKRVLSGCGGLGADAVQWTDFSSLAWRR